MHGGGLLGTKVSPRLGAIVGCAGPDPWGPHGGHAGLFRCGLHLPTLVGWGWVSCGGIGSPGLGKGEVLPGYLLLQSREGALTSAMHGTISTVRLIEDLE